MMHCLCNMILFFLMLIPHSNLVRGMYDKNAIKEDLTKFNITCEKESCQHSDTSSYRYCNCGIHCSQLGTCCYDSNHTGNSQLNIKLSCRAVRRGFFYFMVDQCSSSESVWANLCNTEWDGEDDPQRIFPVTSLSSSVTYKNYYCFRCHETTEDFLYWTATLVSRFKVVSRFKEIGESPPTSLSYNKNFHSWVASYEDTGAFFVKLYVSFPYKIKDLVHICDPSAISDCSSEWSDEDVQNKCQTSYMALKEVRRGYDVSKYKNIHCALCNFENLTDISCAEPSRDFVNDEYSIFRFADIFDIDPKDGTSAGKNTICSEEQLWDPYKRKCQKLVCAVPGYKIQNGKCVYYSHFSFAHLLDINRENGGLVGKRCSEDHLWDPFNRKCKKLVCALPGYKIQNRKCVQG